MYQNLDVFEVAQISDEVILKLPQLFCENFDLFTEIVNWETWLNILTDTQREYLKKFLPCLPNQDRIVFDLFNGDSCTRFEQNTLQKFHHQLRNGYFRPDILSVRKKLRKEQIMQARFEMKLYKEQMVRDLIKSKQKVLEFLTEEPSIPVTLKYSQIDYVDHEDDVSDDSVINLFSRQLSKTKFHKPRSIYQNEMTSIRKMILSKKRRNFSDDNCNWSSSSDENLHVSVKEPTRRPNISDEYYKSLLSEHKKRQKFKRKGKEKNSSVSNLLSLIDIRRRANFAKNRRQLANLKHEALLVRKSLKRKKNGTSPLSSLDVSEESSDVQKISDSDCDNVSSNFLTLLRDVICATADQRMSFSKLEKRIKKWQEQSINNGVQNEWIYLKKDWSHLIGSALGFLCGENRNYSKDFVPYVEYKSNIEMYQWIGAGRDSDILLVPLFDFWLDNIGTYTAVNREQRALRMSKTKKDNIVIKTEPNSNNVIQQTGLEMYQLPDCNIDDKKKKKVTHMKTYVEDVSELHPDDLKSFRDQERQRYENPLKPFRFKFQKYEFVVGPVKGLSTNQNSKGRSHPLLVDDRPPAATLAALIRDAVCRLPSGEGSRIDICKLLRYSQYVSQTAQDNVIQTVVSGALERIHSEFDSCVKYDSNRKSWQNLHKNRSEVECLEKHAEFVALLEAKKSASANNKKLALVSASENCTNAVPVPVPVSVTTTNAISGKIDVLPSNCHLVQLDSTANSKLQSGNSSDLKMVPKLNEKLPKATKTTNSQNKSEILPLESKKVVTSTNTQIPQLMSYSQSPIVAKVVTNSSGQVISVENLLATTSKINPDLHKMQKTKQTNLVQLKSNLNQNSIDLNSANSTVTTTINNHKTSAVNKSLIRLKSQPQSHIGPANVTVGKLITTLSGQTAAIHKSNQGQLQTQSLTQVQSQSQLRMINAANITSVNGQHMIIQQSVPNMKAVQTTSTANLILTNRSTTNNNRSSMAKNQQTILKNANGTTLASNSQVLMTTSAQSHINVLKSNHQPVVFKVAQQATQSTPSQVKPIVLTNSQLSQLLSQQIFVPANFSNTINIRDLQGFKMIPVTQAKSSKQILARVVTPKSASTTQQSVQAIQILSAPVASVTGVTNIKWKLCSGRQRHCNVKFCIRCDRS